MEQNRWKSWALWLAVAALVVWVVNTFCHIDITEQVNTFMNLLCPVLVLLGIINNPKDKTRF